MDSAQQQTWLASVYIEADSRVAGVDEAGRGPLVGAVVAAAVILDPARPIIGLADSKRLSEKRREALDAEIRQHALAFAIGEASATEIDTINILQATMRAMQRAISALALAPHTVLIDGNRTPDVDCTAHAVVKGDGWVDAISAASILAKVARDRQMHTLHAAHPGYGFDRHKGYPTKAHLAAIERHGVLDMHRRSFAPVRRALAAQKTRAAC